MAGRPAHASGGPPSAAARPPGIPPHPQTLDGAAVLHQMFRLDRAAWRMLDGSERSEIADEASSVLLEMEAGDTGGSALFSLLGHKGDLWWCTSDPIWSRSIGPSSTSPTCA